MNGTGLIHLYYGSGKGKTTCAIGLGVRAAGRGFKVLMLQFLKGQTSGEQLFLSDNPSFRVEKVAQTSKFIHQMTESEKKECKRINENAFLKAIQSCEEEKIDVLILDEITDCINSGVLNKTLLRNLLLTKPEELEVVLTGRKPEADIIQLADYVSEITMVKHPYENGVSARLGIEV